MKTNAILLMALLMVLACRPAAASPVDVDAATRTASQFLNARPAGMRMAPTSASLRLLHAEASAADEDKPVYYIFNADDAAFVIVAGDDRAEAVLAYGEGPLDMNAVPCNVQWLLDQYKEQIGWLMAHDEVRPERAMAPSHSVVAPLLSCNWSQSEPYYDQCPTYHGATCLTGCIATAMAQMMYYWKYPDELPDLPAYTSNSYGINVPALPGGHVDWDNMLDSYQRSYTPAQAEAVAMLMRYCGQASFMDYGPSASGSFGWNQMVGLQVFGYSLSSWLLHREEYDAMSWRNLMIDDLTLGYPILYTGHGEEGGHAFVVDGYDGHNFHINWGWNGDWNGYFALDAFDVAGMSFSSGQKMLYHQYPDEYLMPKEVDVDGLRYRINGDEATLTYTSKTFASYSGRITVPAQVTVDGVAHRVTVIGNNAFRNCKELTAVTLPPTIKRIGNYAFMGCTGLTSMVIPASVEQIGYCAFSGCRGLTSLTLQNGVKRIGYYAFENCSGIKRLTVPGSVDTLGVACFKGCVALSEVTLKDGVVAIGDEAFSGCMDLRKVTLGESLEQIGHWVFRWCFSLERLIALPEEPAYVEADDAFEASHFRDTKLVVREIAMDNYICLEPWTRFQQMVCLEDEVMPGDVNGDNEVSIADVNALVDAILADTGMVDIALYDVNGDGEVNIADVNAVIDLIIR